MTRRDMLKRTLAAMAGAAVPIAAPPAPSPSPLAWEVVTTAGEFNGEALAARMGEAFAVSVEYHFESVLLEGGELRITPTTPMRARAVSLGGAA